METTEPTGRDGAPAPLPVDLTDLDLFTQGFPHDVFTVLRRDAPVWWHEPTDHTPDGQGFWVVSRHAAAQAVARDAETFSSERAPGRDGGGTLLEDLPWGFASGVLLNMQDDPRHARIRRLLTSAVSARALSSIEADLERRTAAILDDVAPAGGCDFLIDVAAELPLQAIAGLLGVPQADRHDLFRWADATLDYDDRDLGQQSAKVAAAQGELFAYGTELIEAKRRAPAGDLLSVVATAEVDGPDGLAPLTDLEVQMFFNLLIAAGAETTRNSIAYGLLALIEHPDQQVRLRADPRLLPTAADEILRWASSTTYNRRTATRDTVLGGQSISEGDKVTLWWASANRDEAVFADPFMFDVGRDPNPHLAFGNGAHFCLGAALARMEIRIVFAAVLDRLADIAVAGPIEWTRSNKHTGLRHLPISYRPR